jgi:hypothetical protein
LVSLFDTGAWVAAEAATCWAGPAGTKSRPMTAVAAAPTTRKPISATIVTVLVKKVSILADVWPFYLKLDDN